MILWQKAVTNRSMWRNIFVLISFIFTVAACHRDSHVSTDSHHAVIIMYHRFGEDQYPATSVTLKQFQAQIQSLVTRGYHVMPVPVILQSLKEGKSLPDKTVGITIDDAYESVFTQAWPQLRAAHLPFTLMVSTDPIDKHYKDMMTWDQIRQLAKQGVTIGVHSASHLHFTGADDAVILSDLQHAQDRLQKELGIRATLFAYPYGEYQPEQEELLKQVGVTAAFKQVSGVITQDSDFYALPRFPINQSYGDKDRFELVTQALPFTITDLSPASPVIDSNPPIISFKATNLDLLMTSISCYQSDLGQMPITIDQNRVIITPAQPFILRRTHINCTVADKSKRWHWLGLMYILPNQPEG